MALAFDRVSPDEVDRIWSDLVQAGYQSKIEPWDAIWGMRYAVIHDPGRWDRRSLRDPPGDRSLEGSPRDDFGGKSSGSIDPRDPPSAGRVAKPAPHGKLASALSCTHGCAAAAGRDRSRRCPGRVGLHLLRPRAGIVSPSPDAAERQSASIGTSPINPAGAD